MKTCINRNSKEKRRENEPPKCKARRCQEGLSYEKAFNKNRKDSIIDIVKAILKKLLYEMLPQNIYCISCGKITDEENYMSICKDCIEKMNRSCEKRVCVKCGKILRRSFTDDICRDCANGFRNFEKGVSPFGYGFVERRIVSNFKSKNRPYMARYMGGSVS